jgi:hypothetical protein
MTVGELNPKWFSIYCVHYYCDLGYYVWNEIIVSLENQPPGISTLFLSCYIIVTCRPVAEQWPVHTYTTQESFAYVVTSRNKTRGVASGVLCHSAPRLYSYDWLTDRLQCNAIQYSGASWLWVSEWGRGLLRFSPCDPLLLEFDSWGTGIIREPRVRGRSAVGSRYQVRP